MFEGGLRPLKPDEALLRQRLRRVKAEGTGFEPVKGLLPRVFETRAIGHYANPPISY